MDAVVSFVSKQQRPLALLSLAGLAFVSVQRRAAAVAMAAAAPKKFTCSGDGTDCPCHSSEKRAPPAAPVTPGPAKVTLAPGESKYICNCGESKSYPFCDGSHRTSANAVARGLKSSPLTNTTDAPKDFCACAGAPTSTRAR